MRANLKQLLAEQQEVESPASSSKLGVGNVVPGNEAIRQSLSIAKSSHSSVGATGLCYVPSDLSFQTNSAGSDRETKHMLLCRTHMS